MSRPPFRPRPTEPQVYGNAYSGSFWVEYPLGLVDLTRSINPVTNDPPQKQDGHLEISVQGDRSIRIDPGKSAIVIVDMQNFFLHPDLSTHPRGLACVDPLLALVPFLRHAGMRIIWLNWGLTTAELASLPPALARSFAKPGRGGFGADIGGGWGPLLMRGARNADLYGPLHEAWLKGQDAGTDIWMHKNRMGGLWGSGFDFETYLKEEGIQTLFFAGVNTDQCVLGTVVDAYFNGYDVVVVEDATATTSTEDAMTNFIYNAQRNYGFVTNSESILRAV